VAIASFGFEVSWDAVIVGVAVDRLSVHAVCLMH
jgi:hypothetical protein